ncbi:MAG: serine/threonine protein kinase [Candidatus Eremiobacteraeota bacterium]|nr:serine/threonine protein kinase [Candidatus Eremiobacteraeota bacterium]
MGLTIGIVVVAVVVVAAIKFKPKADDGERAHAGLSNQAPDLTKLGRYKITEKIGKNEDAVLYKGTSRGLGGSKTVLLKVYKPDSVTRDDFQARFYREMLIGHELDHPNIVKVISGAEEEGMFYLALEHVDGTPLSERMAEGPVDRAQALKWLTELLRGLEHAHRHNVIHRNLNPQAILIDDEGTLRLTDFGLGKTKGDVSITKKGVSLGTPAYLAPELITRGTSAADARADQYSAGVVAYELLSGRLPYPNRNLVELTDSIVAGEMTPLTEVAPDVPDSVVGLVETMLANSPDKRFPALSTALTILEELAEAG